MSSSSSGIQLLFTYDSNLPTCSHQPFDLTDYDWSPELWIACHDEDEQNARLANHLWEDNGLDVAETFLRDLLHYFGT